MKFESRVEPNGSDFQVHAGMYPPYVNSHDGAPRFPIF